MKRFLVTMLVETDSDAIDASSFDSPTIITGEYGTQLTALSPNSTVIADLTIVKIEAKRVPERSRSKKRPT